MPVRVSITPGTPSLVVGSAGGTIPKGGVKPVDILLTQVAGLVPLTKCDDDECREDLLSECCDKLIVFGEIVSGVPTPVATYENDSNPFLVNYSLANNNPLNTLSVTFTLQKSTGGVWSDVATLNNNLYGTYYQLGHSLFINSGHKGYAMYQLNWGKVLHLQGEGCYRIKVEGAYNTVNEAHETTVKTSCLASEIFLLKTWECKAAHRTVKFECFLSGKIGDVYVDYKIHDVCNLSVYDSIRFSGFLGNEKVQAYNELMHEYQTGLQRRIRDEAIQQFTLQTGLTPKYLLDRFKIYALMSDTLYGSDYNINNSDYNIKRKLLVRASSFEPVYFDQKFKRKQKVTVEFKRGVQSVIKTICCDLKAQTGSVG